jgi:hypothetical protein
VVRFNSRVNRLSRAALAVMLLAPLACSHEADPVIPPPPANASETTKAVPSPSVEPIQPLAPPELRKYCRTGDVLNGVYSPGRLTVKNPCVAVTGVVGNVALQHDGDLHIALTGVDAKWLNEVNVSRTDSSLVVEIVPAIPIPGPAVRSRITVVGPWVLDTETGWFEVHPVWAILPAV